MSHSNRKEIAIIGGGIVGLATAMALVEGLGHSVTVIEAEERLAAHQTGNNSGVIHSGLYYKPGSLKARNCVEGREALYRFCAEEGIPHEMCGKVVVATCEEQLPALNTLEERGRANGLKGLKRLNSHAELKEYEPNVQGIAGLWVPETGIVDYVKVSEAYARRVRDCGGEIVLGARMCGFRPEPGGIALDTTQGTVRARFLINCGGLQSDRIARMCGLQPQMRIIPFRGEYYDLKPECASKVKNLIYPVPNPKFPFLGVHFTRMVKGGVEAGPNAVLAFKREGYSRFSFCLKDFGEIFDYPAFWKMAGHYWKTGLGEFYRSFSKQAFVKSMQNLVPSITINDVKRGGAGVRAQALDASGRLADDFMIEEGERMIHVLNAPSPAATASISIGKTIAARAERLFSS